MDFHRGRSWARAVLDRKDQKHRYRSIYRFVTMKWWRCGSSRPPDLWWSVVFCPWGRGLAVTEASGVFVLQCRCPQWSWAAASASLCSSCWSSSWFITSSGWSCCCSIAPGSAQTSGTQVRPRPQRPPPARPVPFMTCSQINPQMQQLCTVFITFLCDCDSAYSGCKTWGNKAAALFFAR